MIDYTSNYYPAGYWSNYWPLAVPVLAQRAYRFSNNDGDEDEATVRESENTPTTGVVNEIIRLRFLIDAVGSPTGKQFRLEYRPVGSGGSWRVVS